MWTKMWEEGCRWCDYYMYDVVREGVCHSGPSHRWVMMWLGLKSTIIHISLIDFCSSWKTGMNLIQSAHTWEMNWHKKLDDRHMVISTVRSPAQPRRVWLHWTSITILAQMARGGSGLEIEKLQIEQNIGKYQQKGANTVGPVSGLFSLKLSVTHQTPLAPKWLTDHRYSNADIYAFYHCQAATCTYTNTQGRIH